MLTLTCVQSIASPSGHMLLCLLCSALHFHTHSHTHSHSCSLSLSLLIACVSSSFVCGFPSVLTLAQTSAGELSQSIIICLANLFEHLPPHSKFFRRFIWIVLSLIQIHDVKIFLPSVNLFEAVLRALDENEELRGYGLSAYCMEAREGSLAPLLAKLDQVSGCSFKQQFSFAVAGHLLKGFRNANTKTPTTRLLGDIARR